MSNKMVKENFSLKWSSSNSVKNFANFFDGISRNPWNLIMKLGHLKDFSSSKDVCISQDKKVLLHKQAIFSTFNNKMAADSLHFIIYCFNNFIWQVCNENLRNRKWFSRSQDMGMRSKKLKLSPLILHKHNVSKPTNVFGNLHYRVANLKIA